MENKEYIKYTSEKDKQQVSRLSFLRSYTVALLMLIPSINEQFGVKYGGEINNMNDMIQKYFLRETNEVIPSYESVFKDGIRKALEGINSIDQLPLGGKNITYYWPSGKYEGQPMPIESVKLLNLPDKFDISPRVVGKDPVSCMYVILGNRVFSITPDIGTIANISLNSKELVVEINVVFDVINQKIVYDKQDKLPDLMYRLWMTPKGKGEKYGFKATTVKEL